MDIRQWTTLLICTAFFVLSGDRAFSSELENMMTGHAFYGKMRISDKDSDLEGGGISRSIFSVQADRSPLVEIRFCTALKPAHISASTATPVL